VIGQAGSAGRAADATDNVDFNFRVRPILSDRCFKCHGPDEKARKAKLRLDSAESAYSIRDQKTGTRAIVPGHPEQSELYRRITAPDDDDRMPPPASNLSLNDKEKELLRRWIEQGAQYKPHWAFIPVGKVAVPKNGGNSQARNSIDSFVLARMAREGLEPAPEAPRETLIRRLSFDLRGLPPTLQEIDEFLADTSPNAYEKLVDALLASPAYGEHQARQWLDLARYADTYGYQSDMERDMSPWRDWVIRAFNENLPYDRFVLWQLAGDLLNSPTRDQVLATAFNRLHRQTNEGGSIEDEFRTEYVADRVQTAGTAFLGLTVGCARCHDHKYDPITQKDYYRMFAFFNNIDESGLYSYFTMATPSPTLLLYPAGVEAKHNALKEQMRTNEMEMEELAKSARGRFDGWAKSGTNTIPKPEPLAAFAFDEVVKDSTPDRMSTNLWATLVDGPTQVEGKSGKALEFSGDNSVICKGVGAFNRTTPFSLDLWLKPLEKQGRAVIFHRSRAWSDSGSRGYELLLEDGKPSFGLIHFWPGNALKVCARMALPTNEWSHLTITYDGSSQAAGVCLYLNGEPLAVDVVRDNLFKDILHRSEWGDTDVGNIELTLAGRFRDSGFKNGAIDEFEIFDRCLTAGEVNSLIGRFHGRDGKDRTNGRNASDHDALFAYYLQQVDGPYRAAAAELRKMREEENRLINDVQEIMVMKEMPQRRPSFVLKRGAYDAPGDSVEPGTPEKIFPFSDGLPRNRLGLARWMVDRRNPLTARVEVNRVWRNHFGRGLVATEEDFGTQGKLPTHPELLDWLALNFMEDGWDVKALHKFIVMSATYRQSSRAEPELLANDPENALLARGPKHRLQAEEIRDNALAVSGLLSTRVGGPSARPYQPEGLWEEAGTGKHYKQDTDEGLYRRSLYTFWKRTAPPPSMLIFDAVSREVCTARRETTATPLQALVLLNDPQFVEAARVLAEQLVKQCGQDVDACITKAFRLATGRKPEPREQEILRRLYHEQLGLFENNPAAAEQYLKTGEHPLDQSLPGQQVAATAVLASTLMNLDEFVTER
jgi:uncharacterized protein DUF1553/uncharacterized protein DUF1549/concanavalin A-like lectin/glucanase superfamily protein/cytochrome c